jgi:hypothetical protein
MRAFGDEWMRIAPALSHGLRNTPLTVVPAQAGTQVLLALPKCRQTWIPACAGMTVVCAGMTVVCAGMTVEL